MASDLGVRSSDENALIVDGDADPGQIEILEIIGPRRRQAIILREHLSESVLSTNCRRSKYTVLISMEHL